MVTEINFYTWEKYPIFADDFNAQVSQPNSSEGNIEHKTYRKRKNDWWTFAQNMACTL